MPYLCDRYEERLRYIQNITRNKVPSTYEEFCENVMHPLEMGSSQSLPAHYSLSGSHASPLNVPSGAPPVPFTSLLRSMAQTSSHHHHHQPSPFSNSAKLPSSTLSPYSNLSVQMAESLSLSSSHSATPRPRSSTNEERLHAAVSETSARKYNINCTQPFLPNPPLPKCIYIDKKEGEREQIKKKKHFVLYQLCH